MIKAWRRPDGKYRLTFDSWAEEKPLHIERIKGRRGCNPRLEDATWTCDGYYVDMIGAQKVYGVLAGPSSCGCEPLGFRWVTESEVKAGQTTMKPCHDCAMRRFHPPSGPFAYVRHQCDIIDVCGEADFAEAVYEAEFAHRVGAIT